MSKYINADIALTHTVDLVVMLEQFTRQTKCSKAKNRRIRDPIPTGSTFLGKPGPAYAKESCKNRELPEGQWCRECRARAAAFKLCGLLESES